MRTVEAYKNELTGAIYEDRRAAATSEFKAMMKRASGSVCALGSVSTESIYAHLATTFACGVYRTALPELLKALAYLQQNHELITGEPMVILEEEHAP